MGRSTFQQAVQQFIADHALWPPGSTVLIAVSGGPDSLALLHALHVLAPEQGLRLHIAHLDHQLRADSLEDARAVSAVAQAWNIPATIEAQAVRPHAAAYGGVEAAARAVRYGFLRRTAVAMNASAVATGHNADDQAETVLQRLMRGAGPAGLAGMRPSLPFDRWRGIGMHGAGDLLPAEGPALVRPLLAISRADIDGYCREQGLQPRHDPSNDSPEYLRNRVRGYIIPHLKAYNSNIVAALGRTARVCADEDSLLSELLDQYWPALARDVEGQITMERAVWDTLHRALRRRALRRAAWLLAPRVELGADHLDRMQRLAERRQGTMQLPGKLSLRVTSRQIVLARG